MKFGVAPWLSPARFRVSTQPRPKAALGFGVGTTACVRSHEYAVSLERNQQGDEVRFYDALAITILQLKN